MSEWREVVGRPPPKNLSRPLMVQILSHTYQLDTVGGYTKRLDRRLKSAARRDVVRPAFKPGSRFVREYHGITHVVEVSDDGRFVWNEQSFKSLSHTARAITGYNVSGFQFFGVRPCTIYNDYVLQKVHQKHISLLQRYKHCLNTRLGV